MEIVDEMALENQLKTMIFLGSPGFAESVRRPSAERRPGVSGTDPKSEGISVWIQSIPVDGEGGKMWLPVHAEEGKMTSICCQECPSAPRRASKSFKILGNLSAVLEHPCERRVAK